MKACACSPVALDALAGCFHMRVGILLEQADVCPRPPNRFNAHQLINRHGDCVPCLYVARGVFFLCSGQQGTQWLWMGLTVVSDCHRNEVRSQRLQLIPVLVPVPGLWRAGYGARATA